MRRAEGKGVGEMLLEFTVNGVRRSLEVDPALRLVDVLRDRLDLTGTKEGCGEGECGACTVLLGGRAVNSCLVLALQVQDQEVVTIEGLSKDGQLDPLQQAFIDEGAIQCGYCSPGMLMSSKALLSRVPHPSEPEIRTAIAGNLCRCTGYEKIVRAVQRVAGAPGGSHE
jgi:carbon-monoxide dehydrogenase small subunit